MKAIIGVDAKGQYKSALKLFANLRFKNAEVVLLHAASPVLPIPPIGMVAGLEAQTQYASAVEKRGVQALDEAKTLACDLDIHAETVLRRGSPAEVLTEVADAEGADLVAVCETKPGAWTTTFLGGVSRSLAIDCDSSVLVAKGRIESPKKVTAVFATDHSAYADKCLETLLELKPMGIERIIVLSAMELSGDEAAILATIVPVSDKDLPEWLHEHLTTKNCEVVEKLTLAGYKAESQVVRGTPNECISSVMRKEEADLLIMGAQGHGFLDRLLIGSVSLHQVVAEPYPVLLLRA